MTEKKYLTIKLASPRGFCAGVERAIIIVEEALNKYGAPIYVRHEIVHNVHVVKRLEAMGVIFINDLNEVKHNVPIIFSAHGVPKSVPSYANKNNMIYIDATCPLVSKVHREVERYTANNIHTFLIGHKNHPEVIGTMGQVPADKITLIETIDDIQKTSFDATTPLAYVTQTTLSVDDTQDIIHTLIQKYPHITNPKKEDICYATTNRQLAIKNISEDSDLLLVVGSKNSSNSQRLVEVGLKEGIKQAYLIDDKEQIDLAWFNNVKIASLSAGASAPEYLVEGVLEYLTQFFHVSIEHVVSAKEHTHFKLPKMPDIQPSPLNDSMPIN